MSYDKQIFVVRVQLEFYSERWGESLNWTGWIKIIAGPTELWWRQKLKWKRKKRIVEEGNRDEKREGKMLKY